MYRYSHHQFNKLLLNMGIIRIGTLHDFRCTEHDQGIADPKEGKKTVLHHIENLNTADSADDHRLAGNKDFRALKQFGFVTGNNWSFQNVTFGQEFEVPDCFILCTSKLRSQKVMEQFGSADSCVEIINVDQFCSVITETLNSHSPVIFKGIHEVIYKDREEQWNGQNWGHHPALIKETKFEKQGELRAIWEPQFKRPIAPIILGNYRLPAYCRSVPI